MLVSKCMDEEVQLEKLPVLAYPRQNCKVAFKAKKPWGLLNSFIQHNKVIKYVNLQKHLCGVKW